MSEIIHRYPKNPHTTPSTGTPGVRSFFKSSWTLEAIDAPGAWLIPLSAEQTVCVIDCDFNFAHQDLKSGVVDKADIIKIDSEGCEKNDKGHGTQVAGVIAATHNTEYGRAGVCPGARILPLNVGKSKILMEYGTVDISMSNFLFLFDPMTGRVGEAIGIINKHYNSSEYRVLNISKGGNLGRAKAEDVARKYLLTEVDIFLKRGGVLIVGGVNKKNVLAADCCPAAIKNISSKPTSILVVSSVYTPTTPLWGGVFDPLYDGQNDVDVYAPGSEQEVLDYQNPTGYVNATGNSLAIPHVAGVAAHLFRINPALDGEKVSTTIRETAELQSTLNGGKEIRVVNAFAAALKVYNESHPGQALAGYRVSMPLEFNEGSLEVNGEPVPVVSINNLGHSFCRFTAPKDTDIRARLFKHPSLDTPDSRRCYWEGRFHDLLGCAMPGSRQSAWAHPAVAELRTVQLQGLALSIFYGGPAKEPVRNAQLTLKDRRGSGQWSTRPGESGEFLLPFGEPGPYTLIVEEGKEGGARTEFEFTLQANTIYTEDPNHPGNESLVLPLPNPNRWMHNFEGVLSFEGTSILRYLTTWTEPPEILVPGKYFNIDMKINLIEQSTLDRLLFPIATVQSAGVIVTAGREWIQQKILGDTLRLKSLSYSPIFPSPQLLTVNQIKAVMENRVLTKSANDNFNILIPDKIPDKTTFELPAKNIAGEQVLVCIYIVFCDSLFLEQNYLYEIVDQPDGTQVWKLFEKWQNDKYSDTDPEGKYITTVKGIGY